MDLRLIPVVAVASMVSMLASHTVLAQQVDAPSPQIIIKWREPISMAARSSIAIQAVREAERRVGISARSVRRTATGAEVLRLAGAPSRTELTEFMAALRRSSGVAYVEEDRRLMPTFVPDDPRYAEQWHYFEAAAGINLPPAWDLTSGSGITVAVVDTGYRPHADLAANLLNGLDFISDAAVARDGTGRDGDARDAGDWNDDSGLCRISNSSWHGTHVAGTVVARTNNANGVAGVAFGARVLPVRVLGRCGGSISDIADGMIWAAGGFVPVMPGNPNPARVLNLSLGGTGACSPTLQSAINIARSFSSVVIVAAGNDNVDAANFNPANCAGVITVAAVNRGGGKAFYSNFGSVVDVAAPGGELSGGAANGVLSTLNSGLTVPASDSVAFYQGTSMAGPHVSGIAALMLSRNPALSPDEVESILKNTARPFPAACGQCGTGIVNAFAAASAAVTPPPPAGVVDLIAISKSNTGSGSTEIHVLSGESGLQQFIQNTGTAQHPTDETWEFEVADWDADGQRDLIGIKKSNTGSGSTEVHVLSGSSGFQQYILNTGTAQHPTDATWEFEVADWDGDGRPDLVGIKKSNAGSGSTEVHVLSGSSNFQQYILNTATAQHPTDATWEFEVADWDGAGQLDLIGIKKSNTGSGSTEIHVISGESGLQQYILHTATAQHSTDETWEFEVADWDADGQRDLIGIKKSNTGSGSTEVHVLSGSSGFQQYILNTATALHPTGNTWEFSVVNWP